MLIRAKKKVNKGFHARIRCEACHPLHFLAQQVCEYFSNNSSWLCFIQQVWSNVSLVVSAYLCNKIG